ncbi:lytic transglycosylase domain-containing protein [Arsenophonus nasoniae]|uniref:lytic transglycosylase domain-containing protein n=2 Tax=Arsenophonus TaxID=637 RepID=UPI00387A2DED
MLAPTAFLALAMQCAPGVHPETAFDVARVESNFNPYAIAEIIPKAERSATKTRVISHFPTNKTEALARIKQIEAKKHRYSVGLMQITSTNFARFGMTAEKLLSPCHNLTVFEKILTDCYRRGGSLKRALSCYYAGNFTTGQQPEAQFAKTSYVERIGLSDNQKYQVPATKTFLQTKSKVLTNSQFADKPVVHWPREVIRGVPATLKNSSSI